ncbi:MAG: zinc-ribbon domain-containing protein, partial [Nitrososphaerales archaeon]
SVIRGLKGEAKLLRTSLGSIGWQHHLRRFLGHDHASSFLTTSIFGKVNNIGYKFVFLEKIMPFCRNCGATLDLVTLFCPNCGTPVSPTTQASSAQKSSSLPTGVRPLRPTGVTILGILAILAGIGTILVGLALGFFSIGSVTGIILILFVILGLIWFVGAYGFWVGANWAWWLGIILAVLSILSIISFNVVGLIIGLIVIYYLTRPHVRAWFHQL